jgi:UDP-N-acetylglucosamine transferase subunit ALG13
MTDGTFVSVGNATQPFTRLLDAVAVIAKKLPQPLVIQNGRTPFRGHACFVVEFMGMDEFDTLIRGSQLLILHAGAGAVIHAVQAGKIPVVMPRRAHYGEHIDDHQLELAQELERAGKAIVALEPEHLETAVIQAMSRQGQCTASGAEPRVVQLVRERLAAYASRSGR